MHLVENPGDGVARIFAKIPVGVNAYRAQLPGRVHYFGFYCIFINKFFENLPGGSYAIPQFPLTPHPRVHLCTRQKKV